MVNYDKLICTLENAKTIRVAIGADHAGFALKELLKAHLKDLGHEMIDFGAYSFNTTDDYPDFAKLVAESVSIGKADRGILVCGSGVGASVAANKVNRVRAAMCHDTYSAHQGVEHDDMNVLCVGARIIGEDLAREVSSSFVNARFTGEDRHVRRLRKIQAMENTD